MEILCSISTTFIRIISLA